MQKKILINLEKFFNFFSSVRFTIIILIAIVIVSGIGTFIEQNMGDEFYIFTYGATLSRFLISLSLTDVYHGLPFISLLVLLMINISLCTIDLLPKKISAAFASHPRKRGKTQSDSFETVASLEEAVFAVKKALSSGFIRRLFCRIILEKTDEQLTITSEPLPIFHLGAIIAHISVIVILIGGVISLLFGFSGELFIAEGGQTNTLIAQDGHYRLDFSIRLDTFTLIRYEDGTPREYRSDVSFLSDEGENRTSLTVNHPAVFRNIRFYQANYGMTFDSALIEVATKDGRSLFSGEAFPESPVTISTKADISDGADGDLTFFIIDYSPDYGDMGPAVHIFVMEKKREYAMWLYVNNPKYEKHELGKFGFRMLEYRQIPYSGITAVKEPGLIFIWIGFILISLGFLFPVASSPPTLWAVVQPIKKGDNKNAIHLFGAQGKYKGAGERSFSRFTKHARKSLWH